MMDIALYSRKFKDGRYALVFEDLASGLGSVATYADSIVGLAEHAESLVQTVRVTGAIRSIDPARTLRVTRDATRPAASLPDASGLESGVAVRLLAADLSNCFEEERGCSSKVEFPPVAARLRRASMESLSPQLPAAPAAIERVRNAMCLDERWTARRPDGLQFWLSGHRTSMTWGRPLSGEVLGLGNWINTPVSVRTDLLEGIQPGPRVFELINVLNMHASFSALMFDEQGGRISLRCRTHIHGEIFSQATELLMHAVATQAAEAAILSARGLRSLFGSGRLDQAPHPVSGVRRELDEMTNIIENLYAPAGRGPSEFIGEGFGEAAAMLQRNRVVSNGSPTGLTAEFPFNGTRTGIASRLGLGNGPQTSLLRLDAKACHPRLGSSSRPSLRIERPAVPYGRPLRRA